MKLETSEREWDEVSDAVIAEAAQAVAKGEADFFILKRDETHFIQAAPGWLLEYQDGSIDRHYQAVRRDLSPPDIIAAMQLYASDDESWLGISEWKRIDLRRQDRMTKLWIAVSLVVALVSIGYSIWDFFY